MLLNFFRRRRSPRRAGLRPPSRFFRPLIEELEDRVLLSRLSTVPGDLGRQVHLDFASLGGESDYRNEVGYYVVQDAAGRVNGLLPSDPGYAKAALAQSHLLFPAGATAGQRRDVTLPAGTLVAFYLVQNGTRAAWLAHGFHKGRSRGRHVFFSFPSANADAFNHLRTRPLSGGGCILAWEDLTGGGDRDFNDVVFTMKPLAAPDASPTPTRQPPAAPLTQTSRQRRVFEPDLIGWSVLKTGGSPGGQGGAIEDAGRAILREGDSFLVRLERSFTVPVNPTVLRVTFADLTFDTGAAGFIKDAFEVALVDEAGLPLVHPFTAGRDAFFNITEGQPAALGQETTLASGVITVDVSALNPGSTAKLVLRLVNNDSDTNTSVVIEQIEFPPDAVTFATSPPGNTKFFVADTGSDAAFRYAADGSPTGSFFLDGSITNPLGAAGNLAGDRLWVVDGTSGRVAVHRPDGAVLGSWLAEDVQHPTGITTDGTDVWLVDAARAEVVRYAGAAALTSGSMRGMSAFVLHPDNTAPSDLTTDGSTFWVVDEDRDEVLVYDATGALLGRWQLDPANTDASGITRNPAGGADLWTVDRVDHVVYHYADGANLRSGDATATDTFALAGTDRKPETIADPPTLALDPPSATFPAGSPILVSGRTTSDDPAAPVTHVTVNGRPVEVLDAAGNFFATATLAPGENTFSAVATNVPAETATGTVTFTGMQQAPGIVDLARFADVTGSFRSEYARTSFKEDDRVLFADLAVRNVGQYLADVPLFMVVRNISNPTVHVRTADGLTAEGLPYFDLTPLVQDGTLLTGGMTGFQSVPFFNPDREAFTYDLQFLARLNDPPAVTSVPDVEALVGHPYSYTPGTFDANGDQLTWSLVNGPTDVMFNPATGRIDWVPGSADAGNHAVTLRVEDGRGGADEQTFVLTVLEGVPNRPPVFTATPVTTAHVNTEYTYQATAEDADSDDLTFSLVSGPTHLAVAPAGLVSWKPMAGQIGPQDVTLRVEDGHGGVATQSFTVRVLQEAGNAPPVIVSDPITHFSLPGVSNPATGPVSPTGIDVELGDGDVHTQTVSITLPAPPPPPPPPPAGQGPLTVMRTDDAFLLADTLTAGSTGLVLRDVRLQGQSLAIPVTLPADDEYVLVVGDNDTNKPPFNYSFRLDDDHNDRLVPAEGFGVFHTGTLAAQEVKTFDFTAPIGTVVYYDSQFSHGLGPNLLLTGPYQERVGAGVPGADLGPFVLPRSGPYRLTFFGGSVPVDYRFRLMDLGTSAFDLTLGEVKSGTLTSGRETVAYRFHGTPGQQVYFDDLHGNGDVFRMTLVGPDHTTKYLTSLGSDADDGPATLTEDGTYYLFLSGEQASGTPDYQFRLVDVAATPVLPLDQEKTETLGPGTRSNLYHFDGIAGQRLFFDILQVPPGASWSLSGPGDQRIGGNGGSGFALGDFEVTLPGTGRYTLVIDGTTAAVAPYRFKVVTPDVTTTPLTLNMTTIGTTAEPGEVDEYTFTGSPGQRLYYDALTPTSARLFSPSGATVFTTTSTADRDPFTLTEAGVYRLSVEVFGNLDAVGEYRFRLLDLADQPELPLGMTVNDSLTPGLISHVFRFAGTTGQRLNFDSLLNTANATWTLYGTANQSLGTANLNTDFTATLPQDGLYALVLDGNLLTGPIGYSFRVNDVSEAPVAPSGFSTVHSGSIAAGEVQTFAYTAPAGLLVYFDSLDSSSTALRVELRDPGGALVLPSPFPWINIGPAVLPRSGGYTLTIKGATPTSTGNFAFQLLDLSAAAPPLILGATVTATLPSGSQMNVWSFSGSSGQRLYYDALQSGPDNVRVTLVGPSNAIVGLNNQDSETDSSTPFPLPDTGTYYLLVEGNQASGTPDYSFRLLDAGTAPVLGLDTVVEGTVPAGLQTLLYQFNGTAGQHLFFDNLLTSAFATSALYGPRNQRLGASALSDTEMTLPDTGVYTLAIIGRSATTAANYRFQVVTPEFISAPMTLDTVTEVTISEVGEVREFTFTGMAGQRLFYDVLVPGGLPNVSVSLVSPAGVLLVPGPSETQLITLTETGTYRLTFDGLNDFTGTFRFRLLDTATQTPLPLNTDVPGRLDPRTAANVYHFHGKQGQRLLFTNPVLPGDVVDWALYGVDRFQIASGLLTGGSIDKGGNTDGTLIRSTGIFTNSGTVYNLPASGIVISTGDAATYKSGPNTRTERSTEYVTSASLAQEALLDPITGPLDHYDVTQLDITFDALPGFGPVFFTVVFGSEEYPEFVNSPFIDGFGLFLNGVNLASVDGLPVNIKHKDMKPITGTELDGVLAPNGNPLLTFSAPVVPGSKGNVLTFIVADTSDSDYDTTAFISSLSALPPGPLDIDVIASDPAAGFVNLTGVKAGIQRGQTATFDAQFTGDGAAHSFGLLFVRAGTTNVLGSIPVTISNDYHYSAAAIDPDGDTVTWSLPAHPDGATIDQGTGRISWEPPADGQYHFVVKVEDGRGGVDRQDFFVHVTLGGPNQPPVISSTGPTRATTGLPFTYSVMATDPDDDLLSYYLSDPPDSMTIDRTTGVLSWTPTPAQVGPQAVTVRVLDGHGAAATQSFTVPVVPDTGNRKPTVTSQPVTLAVVGQTYRYDAAATDPDADPLQFDLVVRPDGMSVNPTTGVIVWQPGEEDIGPHRVFLRVRDGRGGVDLQTFEVSVTAGGTAPVITTSAPAAPAVVGRPFEYQIHAQDAENDALTFRLDARPDGMSIDAMGLIRWTPTADQVGNQSVTVVVEDGHGGQTRKTLPITVVADAPNTGPQILSTPRDRIGLGALYLYAVQAVDADNDALTLTLETKPDRMTIDDGMIMWSPTADQLGTHAVTVRVEDGRGGVDLQNFTVTVESRNVNRTPRILTSPVFTAFAGGEYRYDVQGADPDGDPLAWSLDKAPAGMSINPLLGTVRWLPSVEDIGAHEVVIRLFDAQGSITTQAFTVMVEGTNRPPVIRSTPTTLAIVDEVYTYAVRATDPDGQPLSYSLPTRPDGMNIGPTGVITWMPTAAQLTTFDVTVEVTDGAGGTARQVYTVVATLPPNEAPVITSAPTTRAVVGTPYAYTVTARDLDGDRLTFSLTSRPADMTIDPDTGVLTWTPSAGQTGTQQVTVVATDPQGASARQTFTLTIRAQNRAPVITSSPATQVTAGGQYRYDVRATHLDGDRLTYALTAGPQRMTMDTLGRITWAPGATDIGTHAVTITVSDGLAPAVEQTFEVLVQADTQGPRVTLSPATGRVAVGGSLTFVVSASDNVGVVSRQLTVGGVAAALDANGRATVPFSALGVVQAVATARDAAGNATSTTATVVVLDPTVGGAPAVSLDALSNDGVVTAPTDIRGTASDPDGLLLYTLEVKPVTGGAFREIARGMTSVTNDVLGRFDPTLLPNDTYILRLTATDTGGNTASTQTQVQVADELKLGNFALSFVDLAVPVSGIPIQVVRTYDTLTAGESGDFGFGWRLEFRDTRLRTSVPKTGSELDGIFNAFRDGTRVYITLPGGKREGFTFRPIPQKLFLTTYYVPAFVPDPGVTSRLSVPGAQRNTGLLAGVKDFFGASGALTLFKRGDEYVDSNGLPYNPADPFFGGIYELTTRDGVGYKIDGMTGNLLGVSDGNGNQLRFDDVGIHSSAGPEVRFGRDPQGRIISITDPMGKTIRYQYDARGDLITVTDRVEKTTAFVYRTTPAHYLERVIDPLGQTGVRSEYDSQGRLSRLIDAAGKVVKLDFDPANAVETVRDQLGNPTTYEYDARGNVLTEINPEGHVKKRTYDDADNMKTETVILEDGTELTSQFTYDASRNLLTKTDPLGQVTRSTYTPEGQVRTRTDPLGNTITSDYDDRGNWVRETDASGVSTVYTSDASGNLKSRARGGVATTFDYDPAGRMTKQVDALGNVTVYTYDGNGNQRTQSVTVATPAGPRTLVTTREYDNEGRVTKATDREGRVVRIEFDGNGNQVAQVGANGHRTMYVYDERGLLVETIYPDATPATLADNPRTKTEYDAAGRAVARIDEEGRRTELKYNKAGWPVETIYPDATPLDLSDNPRTRSEYDAAGRLTAQIDERNNRTEFEYDAAGRRTVVRDALLRETITTYDAADRPVAVTDALGHTTRFTYDASGRQLATIFHDGTSIRSSYDALGRPTAQTDQLHRTTTYELDAFGRLAAVVDMMNQRTEYGYDGAGNLVSQRDANGHTTGYEYDGIGRRTATVLPLLQRSETVYDPGVNVIRTTDFNRETVTYAYDERNRLVSKSFPDGTQVSYTYTPTGRLQSYTDGRGRTEWEYDERGRMLSRTDPDGTVIRYTYDGAGNRTSVLTPAGTTAYTFDALNRLEKVTDPDLAVTAYFYDRVGNLVRTELPDGVMETREYDVLNRLVFLQNAGPSGVISSYRYTLGPTGRRDAVLEQDGRSVDYRYDAIDRLTEERISDGVNGDRTIGYTYDAVGNRLTRTDSREGLTGYGYDDNDRLRTETRSGDVTVYGYDANGNTLSRVKNDTDKVFYTWDFENRLVGVDTDGDGSRDVTNQYDADGTRVSQTAGGEETRFLIDTSQPFAQVVFEYMPGGPIKVSYVHGNDLIFQSRQGEKSFYLVDGLGSVRTLLDTAGSVTDRYDYDAFGRTLNLVGNTDNAYFFAGEQRDAAVGLDYLRARYLAVGLGRFYSRDPFDGTPNDPRSLAKYVYANADPVNAVDPSGLFTLLEVNIGLAIASTALAIGAPKLIGYIDRAIAAGGAYFRDGWRELNAEELRLYHANPSVGRLVNAAAAEAGLSAALRYDGDSGWLGNGDAYRHGYWSALMTLWVGVDWAQRFGDAHEADEPPGPDKDMDLWNNRLGRNIAVIYYSGPIDGAFVGDKVKEFVDSGRLRRLVPRTPSGNLVRTNTEGNIW